MAYFDDGISALEQAEMDADDQLPDFGYWDGLVWRRKLAKVLRHWTAQKTSAPVAPVVIPLGHKIIVSATHRMRWKRDGTLYFERRGGRLFMALSPASEYRSVPDWALIALQSLPETIEQLQSKKILYIKEPGRQRDRRATEGETQMVAMVCLRRLGKTWKDISTILGIGRKECEQRVKEIECVFRDIQQMAEREQVDLSACHKLNPNWIEHSNPEPGKSGTAAKRAPTVQEYGERERAESSFNQQMERARTAPLDEEKSPNSEVSD